MKSVVKVVSMDIWFQVSLWYDNEIMSDFRLLSVVAIEQDVIAYVESLCYMDIGHYRSCKGDYVHWRGKATKLICLNLGRENS